jgi:hypothetical protein
LLCTESVAVRRKTYVPGALKVAVVLGEAVFAKTTEFGPTTLVQVVATLLGETDPARATEFIDGQTMFWFAPADTDRV